MSKPKTVPENSENPAWKDLSERERRLAKQTVARREAAITALRQATDSTIATYIRRRRFNAVPDGHKARTLSDGMPHGDSGYTTVEAAADRLAYPGTEGVGELPSDGTGAAIDDFFDGLKAAERAANFVLGRINRISRLSKIREYKTGGACACCYRDVPGIEADRLRSLYCSACWMAWCRAGQPDNRMAFEDQRRAELEAERDDGNSETAGQTA